MPTVALKWEHWPRQWDKTMVQYIPSPPGSYPYPNAGRGDLNYQIMGDLGQGAGDIFGALITAHAAQQKKQKQQAALAQLAQMLGGGGTPPPTPTAGTPGAGGMPTISRGGGGGGGGQPQGQQPLMDQRLGQLWPVIMKLSQVNPQLANTMMGHVMSSMFPRTPATQPKPTETWWLNPKTGEPSMVPKEGFASMPPQPVGSFAVVNRAFINRGMTQTNRDENHEAHRVAMEIHVKDHMDKVMGQLDEAATTFEQAYRLSNKVPRITPGAAQDARDTASGKQGMLAKVMPQKNAAAVDYYRQVAPLSAKLAPLYQFATPKQKNDLISIMPEPHDSEADKMAKRRLLRVTIKNIAEREKRRVNERELMIRHQKDAELDAQIKSDYPEVAGTMDQGGDTTVINNFGEQDVAEVP